MTDYHLHTGYSYDNGPVDMRDMVHAALDAGLTHIAFTDHYDPLFPAELAELDFPRYLDEIAEVQEVYSGKIIIAAGIELGLMKGEALELCAGAAELPFDFIIASVHSAAGFAVHSPEFSYGKTPFQAKMEYYEDMLNCIEKFTNFDVLGHLNVIDRYTDEVIDTGEIAEISAIRKAILKTIANMGRGIELNTSSMRENPAMSPRLAAETDSGSMPLTVPGPSMPPEEEVKLFHELGGAYVTTGSDAHVPWNVGKNIDDAEEMLLRCGYKSVAVFSNRERNDLVL